MFPPLRTWLPCHGPCSCKRQFQVRQAQPGGTARGRPAGPAVRSAAAWLLAAQPVDPAPLSFLCSWVEIWSPLFSPSIPTKSDGPPGPVDRTRAVSPDGPGAPPHGVLCNSSTFAHSAPRLPLAPASSHWLGAFSGACEINPQSLLGCSRCLEVWPSPSCSACLPRSSTPPEKDTCLSSSPGCVKTVYSNVPSRASFSTTVLFLNLSSLHLTFGKTSLSLMICITILVKFF